MYFFFFDLSFHKKKRNHIVPQQMTYKPGKTEQISLSEKSFVTNFSNRQTKQSKIRDLQSLRNPLKKKLPPPLPIKIFIKNRTTSKPAVSPILNNHVSRKTSSKLPPVGSSYSPPSIPLSTHQISTQKNQHPFLHIINQRNQQKHVRLKKY